MSTPRSCNQVRVGPVVKKKQRQMVSACVTALSLCLSLVWCSPHIRHPAALGGWSGNGARADTWRVASTRAEKSIFVLSCAVEASATTASVNSDGLLETFVLAPDGAVLKW